MHNSRVLTLLPFASSCALVFTTASTEVLDLNGDWSFAYTHDFGCEKLPEPVQFKTSMPVPGCWDDHLSQARAKALWPDAAFNSCRKVKFPVSGKPPDGTLPYLRGAGWYRRDIDVPAAWRGRQVTLFMGRVVMRAWVWVNGRRVHGHLGHSTRWEVSLGPHLNYGAPNELVIVVANRGVVRSGCAIRGWKGHSGGIFGPVSIEVADTARIADLYVYPDADKLHWRVDIQGVPRPGARLEWRVRDPGTGRVMGSGARPDVGESTEWSTPSLGLEPWSDREPKLYELEVSLLAGDACLDLRRQPFGMRRLVRDGVRLRLNDRLVYLRGACEHAYFPETCTPPIDIDWYRRHVARLKEIGFNWMRFHTWVPTEPYLRAADELGMMVQVEPPTGYGIAEWRDIVRTCRKHPSAVIYCCGNEAVLGERKIAFLRRCAEELHKLAPDALFNPQEALRGVEYGAKNQFGNGLVAEPYPHNPSRLAKLKEFSDVFGQYTWGRLSYGTLGGEQSWIDNRLEPYGRPCLSHEVGIIGCFLDLDLEQRYTGTRIGPRLYTAAREALGRAGLLERAAIYHRNSAAWQRLIRKDVIEMARHCRLITGYDLLGATDKHWHRTGYGCGILNEFDELKPGDSIEDIRRYNNESVLLISDQRRRNLRAGGPFERTVTLSWFGDKPLVSATLRWDLTVDDGACLGRGHGPVSGVIEPGRIESIGKIVFTLPELNRPVAATLSVRLTGDGLRLDNRWSFWVFPEPAATRLSAIEAVTALDEKTLRGLVRGERVILLGSSPLPARDTTFQMGLAGRPQFNQATVIEDHPLTRTFPHDGYCGWQFYRMFHGASAVLFEDMPKAFDPIIEVVGSYKHLRKQAALFEWRVGRGRLLVCSLLLPDSDPAAAWFRSALFDYAASDAFQPRTQVAPAKLAKLLELPAAAMQRIEPTDQAFDKRGRLPGRK